MEEDILHITARIHFLTKFVQSPAIRVQIGFNSKSLQHSHFSVFNFSLSRADIDNPKLIFAEKLMFAAKSRFRI